MLLVVLSGNEETALRLSAALIVGTILGLNRELHGKPAGLRTHALVSLGAAVAAIVVLKSPDGSLATDQNAIGRVVQGIDPPFFLRVVELGHLALSVSGLK